MLVGACRRQLLEAYRAALDAVAGDRAVADHLRREPVESDAYVIAVGKAAERMMAGALGALDDRFARGLLITKYDHVGPVCGDHRVVCIESGHPVPDGNSLAAGTALLAFLADIPHRAEVLFLVSGGTSALVEVLPERTGLEDLAQVNQWLLGAGLDIEAMNRVRKRLSCIKAGRLAAYLEGRRTRNLMMSDVPGDDPRVIGSGLLVPHEFEALAVPAGLPDWLQELLGRVPPAPSPGAPVFEPVETRILIRNCDAREAAAGYARGHGLAVHDHAEPFQGGAETLGRQFARHVIDGPPGFYLWGGESTVTLPDEPGRGGRSQALALAAAGVIAGRDDICLLAAGTDGTDGPTEDAGALVDGETLQRGRDEGLDPDEALRRADAGTFLEASGDLVQTGPTGTNVMDLVLGLKM